MTKVVINACFGGFGLSKEALDHMKLPYTVIVDDRYANLNTENEAMLHYDEVARTDLRLVAAVEELGPRANGQHAELRVIEVQEEYYRIEEYDGSEYIIASNCPMVYYG